MILILFLALNGSTWAHEGGSFQLTKKNTVINKKIELSDKRGKIHFSVRNDGEALGRNFLIEVRSDCSGENTKIEKLPVAEVRSTCAVDAKSYRYSSTKQIIEMVVFEPDAEAYNKQTQVDPLQARLTCLKEGKLVTFDISKYCKISAK